MTPQTDAERKRAALLKDLVNEARQVAANDIQMRKWALEYVAKTCGVKHAEDAAEQAQMLLTFLGSEQQQENPA